MFSKKSMFVYSSPLGSVFLLIPGETLATSVITFMQSTILVRAGSKYTRLLTFVYGKLVCSFGRSAPALEIMIRTMTPDSSSEPTIVHV